MAAFRTVDDYLDAVEPDEAQQALRDLRKWIREAAPDATERISYGIPTFSQHGMVASFAAFKNHCSLFPGGVVGQFVDRLQGFELAKGTVRFQPDRPLPKRLVQDIVEARLKANLAAAAERR